MVQGTDNSILPLFQIFGATFTFGLPKIIVQLAYYGRESCIPTDVGIQEYIYDKYIYYTMGVSFNSLGKGLHSPCAWFGVSFDQLGMDARLPTCLYVSTF